MPDISILEFIVYGVIAYSSVLMLVISVVREIPMTRALSSIRIMGLIPGVICNFVLAGAGLKINTGVTFTNSTILSFNTTEYFYENATLSSYQLILNYPVWTLMHGLFALLLIVFIIFQVLSLLTKTD